MSPACVIAGLVIVGDIDNAALDAASAVASFARPKSSTLTVPSGRSVTLDGFRSRWTIPCSWAASSASAILPGDADGLVHRQRSAVETLRERGPFDELEDERGAVRPFLDSVDLRDVGMIQRGEQLRFALEARAARGLVSGNRRNDFDRDVAAETRVARPVHLAHAARPERAEDVVGADSSTGAQRRRSGGGP